VHIVLYLSFVWSCELCNAQEQKKGERVKQLLCGDRLEGGVFCMLGKGHDGLHSYSVRWDQERIIIW